MRTSPFGRHCCASLFATGLALATALPLHAAPARLAPPTATIGARVGASVALGENTLVLGAPDDDTAGPFAGAAYVYVRKGSGWEQRARLVGRPTTGYRSFGESVAISRDVIVVGAPFENVHGEGSGAVYVYMHNGTNWVEQARLTPTDAKADQLFGDAVAIDGNTIVVGAFLDSQQGSNAGAAYVFTRTGVTWTQRAKLTASDASEFAFFGSAVAIQGHTIVVGAPTAERAYVFELAGAQWTEQAALSPWDLPVGDYSGFGAAVTVDGGTIAVGAPSQSSTELRTGAVYTFRQKGKKWEQQKILSAPAATEGDEFGTSVALKGSRLAVGAPYRGEQNEGAVYLFSMHGNHWRAPSMRSADTDVFSAYFGASVALTKDRLLTGAPAFVDFAGEQSAGAGFLHTLR